MSNGIDRTFYTNEDLFWGVLPNLFPNLSANEILKLQAEYYKTKLTDEQLAGLLAFGYSAHEEDRPYDISTITPNSAKARLIVITFDQNNDYGAITDILGMQLGSTFNKIYTSPSYDGIYVTLKLAPETGDTVRYTFNAINSECELGECFAQLKGKARTEDEKTSLSTIQQFAEAENKFDAFVKLIPNCSAEQLRFMWNVLKKMCENYNKQASSPICESNFANNIPFELDCIDQKTLKPTTKKFTSEKECKAYLSKLIAKLDEKIKQKDSNFGE